MQSQRLVIFAFISVFGLACSSSSDTEAAAGSSGTGGAATGGSAGTGGLAGTGGTAGSGGVAGTGGAAGTGGVAGTGGAAGTGGTEAGTGGTEAGTGGTEAGTGGTTTDGSAEAQTDAPSEAASDCNAVVIGGTAVTETCAGTTTPPAQTGPTAIPDGIYDTTAVANYQATCSSLGTGRESAQVAGTAISIVTDAGSGIVRRNMTFTYSTAGALSIVQTCPATDAGTRSGSYTLTADGFTLLIGTEVHTFKKRP